MGRTSSLLHRLAGAGGILLLVVVMAVAVASPGSARSAAPSALGAKNDRPKDDKFKDDKFKKDKDKKDKDGESGPTTVPAPAAPPAPPAVSVPPAPPVSPAPPAVPGSSATPTVALDTPSTTPAVAESVGVAVASGTVYVRTDDGRPAQPLAASSAIPVGAHVDARAGTVELTSAVDATGATQTATFSGAVFAVRQPRDADGLTQIVLTGGPRCAATTRHATRAVTARRRKPVRSLWGQDDHGRFQTHGRGSVATVRGTRWLTQDSCDGTLTRVTRGAVAVRDLAKHKTVIVHAGHSYFAAR
jgi:hypothetical protein